MKTCYCLSDLHVDFFLNSPNKKGLDTLYKWMFKEYKPDYFIIAGDISNTFRHTIDTLNYFGERCEKVFWTHGNHDYVMPRKFHRPVERNYGYIKAIAEECRGNVIWLNGKETHKIGNKTIGGTMGCADWKYPERFLNEDMQGMSICWSRWYDGAFWLMTPNECIKLMGEEKQKINKVAEEADIMVTHFCPFTSKNEILEKYHKDLTTGFFYFEADEIYEILNKKHNPRWIFGHTHDSKLFNYDGITFYCNAWGYPRERNIDIEEWRKFLIEV